MRIGLIPKLILLFVVIGIFLYNFENYAAASCEDLGIHYGSFSICSNSNTNAAKSEKIQETVLRLFDMKNPFNEGGPIVFVGKLTNKSGAPISGAKITVLHDGLCQNKTIGIGTTDKIGRFLVFTTAKVWDEKDNLVKVRAEFFGKGKLLPSTSESKIIVVLPHQNKGC
jgi:hypothetical protein